jgi:hypothetical protein
MAIKLRLPSLILAIYIKAPPTNKKFTQLEQSEKKIKKITDLIKKNLALTSPLGLIQRLYLDKIPSFF